MLPLNSTQSIISIKGEETEHMHVSFGDVARFHRPHHISIIFTLIRAMPMCLLFL